MATGKYYSEPRAILGVQIGDAFGMGFVGIIHFKMR